MSKLRSTPSRVVIFSPSLGGPDDQRAVGHLVEVEGVQGLGGQQHHVVGDVDDVVDRPHARPPISRAFSHSGEGPIVTSVKTRAVNRGQSSGTSTVTEA